MLQVDGERGWSVRCPACGLVTRLSVVTPTTVDDDPPGPLTARPILTLDPARPANLARLAAPFAWSHRRGPRLTEFAKGLIALVSALLTIVTVVLVSFGIVGGEDTMLIWFGAICVLSMMTMFLALMAADGGGGGDWTAVRRLVWMDEMARASGARSVAVMRDHEGRRTHVYETPRIARIVSLIDELQQRGPSGWDG